MDSEIVIHFTHKSEEKSKNTFNLHFLQQFKERHVKCKVFQLIFACFLKIIFNLINPNLKYGARNSFENCDKIVLFAPSYMSFSHANLSEKCENCDK